MEPPKGRGKNLFRTTFALPHIMYCLPSRLFSITSQYVKIVVRKRKIYWEVLAMTLRALHTEDVIPGHTALSRL